MSWQRRARLFIAVATVGFAVVLAFAFRDRPAPDAPPPVVSTDPEALVESAGGQTVRIDRAEERITIQYDTAREYADGRRVMQGITMTSERRGQTFTVVAREGEAAKDDSLVELTGDVRLTSTDSLSVDAERATYQRADGIVRAPGPVTFSKGRTSGSSVGLDYDLNREILHLLSDAVVRVAGDEGAASMEIASDSAEFRRLEGVVQFRGGLDGTREGQRIAADEGTAHLAGENDTLERLLLRGNSRITGVSPQPGGLEIMSARDIDLEYREDGQTLNEAVLVENAEIRLAGARVRQGRRINANRMEFATTADGSAPRTLDARGQVRMQLPADSGGAARTIQAGIFVGDGDDTRGITRGRFTGDVLYQERTADRARTARSQTLETALAPGLGDVEEARFEGAVHFEDGAMTATSDRAVYSVDTERLELRGATAGAAPRLVDERITVEADSIDVGFEGPQITAAGAVKSELRPDQKDRNGENVRRPSMLKADQPVLVVSDRLVYAGADGKATYTGNARLNQGETAIRADALDIDERTGNLAAKGSPKSLVVTQSMLEQVTRDQERRRVSSVARAVTFTYEESDRRATYEGQAHVTGPQGDMRARRIELFLKESGSEVGRLEAYDDVTLIESIGRTTTGSRLTYFGEDERFYVVGEPVRVVDGVDRCRRETVGRTLTFFQNTDRVIVDGNEQMRTRTTGAAQCP
jgi:LPS export ABC transporter protein LptC/lipopolysaccharide transport protein LptA